MDKDIILKTVYLTCGESRSDVIEKAYDAISTGAPQIDIEIPEDYSVSTLLSLINCFSEYEIEGTAEQTYGYLLSLRKKD